MNTLATTSHCHLPARFERPSVFQFSGYLAICLLVVYAFSFENEGTPSLYEGASEMYRLLSEMFPPDISRMTQFWQKMSETIQMALAGTILGVLVSFPLSALASTATTPHRACYVVSRLIVSLFRTVPDLVWALFFVATVGIGPLAGILTLTVDTIGFCGRFFAEAMEEVDPGPQNALVALGASKTGAFISSVIPAALPSFVNSSLFSLEKAVRSSVVLGLVGAGGIGVELKVSMDMFQYDQACTIILGIFILVLLVERVSSSIRSKIIH